MESTGNYNDLLERQILQELEKRTAWNVIAQKLHVSTGRIAKVKVKYSSSQAFVNEAGIDALAFELFEMGKDAVEVTIELKQSPKLIQELYDLWIQMGERSRKQEERSKKLEESYRQGYDDAMKTQHFKAPCSICGFWMDFSSKVQIGRPKSGHDLTRHSPVGLM